MTDDAQLLTRRRAAERPQWSGLVPEALFGRLEAEPIVGDALCELGDALLKNASGRMLEFVALRTSVARDCLYMWRGHCRIALKRPDDPLSPDEIARIAAFAGSDAAVLAAIDELLSAGRLSARTRSAVGDRELILTIASLFYDTIAIIMRDAEPDEEAVAGLETPAAAARAVAR
jgi:alkylhydroperoxidase family enzyme